MPYNRVHIDGQLGLSSERFSCSVAFATPLFQAEDDPALLAAAANGILAAFEPGTGWPGTLRTMIGADSRIEKVRIYHHPAVGADADVSAESTGAAVIGSGTIINDFTAAMCVSLSTGRPGRSYRGRFYWPFLTATTTSGGRINVTSVTSAARASAFAQMLQAIAGEFSGFPEFRPMVVSETLGVLTPVSAVRCGDVLDTQRRRRDKLNETYGSATV